MPRRFADTVAVVTGAGSGIGAASAVRLAAEGAVTVLVDLGAEGLAHTVERIEAAGGQASAVVADVSDEAVWGDLAGQITGEYGGLDVLVSNAGYSKRAAAHELDPADWDRQLNVNLRPLYLAVRAFHGHWKPGAAVVAMSSVHAYTGLPGRPAYAAAKGGLLALVRQLAVEYGPALRVNAIVPGPIMSPAWNQVSEEDRARSVGQTVLGRFGSAGEVASVVAFLASADASYLTGESITVDGGWLLVKDSV